MKEQEVREDQEVSRSKDVDLIFKLLTLFSLNFKLIISVVNCSIELLMCKFIQANTMPVNILLNNFAFLISTVINLSL